MEDFDWVRKRSECSLKATFHALYEEVKSNVRSANDLKLRDIKFTAIYQHGKIIVTSEKDDVEADSIIFVLAPTSILVQEFPDKHLFSARPLITTERNCGLEVDGQAFEIWQVSKKALDGLFFGH